MRISDWSSDVCSSDLWYHVTVREGRNRLVRRLIESQKLQVSRLIRISYGPIELGRGIKSGTAREATPAELLALLDRSEERRVGKECVSTCRSRWSPDL